MAHTSDWTEGKVVVVVHAMGLGFKISQCFESHPGRTYYYESYQTLIEALTVASDLARYYIEEEGRKSEIRILNNSVNATYHALNK